MNPKFEAVKSQLAGWLPGGLSFLWPSLLWLLLLIPLSMIVYLVVLRGKRRRARAFGSLAIVQGAGIVKRSWLRRHLPPMLMLFGLVAMLVAVARPTAVVLMPFKNQTIVLAMDSSLSMRAGDVEPSRIEAAQLAAKTFIGEQPADTRIGLVSFAATASVVQPPTLNRADVVAAIDRHKLQKGTAIGSAILVALGVLFPDEDFELKPGKERSRPGESGANAPGKAPAERLRSNGLPAGEKRHEPVEPGSYSSAVIVLLTDGQSTVGPDPAEAAKLAAEYGVRIYTIGVGTPGGEVIEGEGWKVRVKLDEGVLRSVAATTRGEYFQAGSGSELRRIYEGLKSRFVLEKKQTEVSALLSALAALLVLLSAGLSLSWNNRVL